MKPFHEELFELLAENQGIIDQGIKVILAAQVSEEDAMENAQQAQCIHVIPLELKPVNGQRLKSDCATPLDSTVVIVCTAYCAEDMRNSVRPFKTTAGTEVLYSGSYPQAWELLVQVKNIVSEKIKQDGRVRTIRFGGISAPKTNNGFTHLNLTFNKTIHI